MKLLRMSILLRLIRCCARAARLTRNFYQDNIDDCAVADFSLSKKAFKFLRKAR